MQHPYSRKLDNLDLIQHFLTVVLKHEKADDTDLLNKIKSGEAEIKNYGDTSATLNSTSHRDRKYLTDTDRWKLRSIIVEELMTLPREESDDDISLGKGGALPSDTLNKDNQAFILIGLPASGKSSVANKIADHYGAIILDSDFAKRKLPEFKNNPAGASLVHDESDSIIFGYSGNDKPDEFKSVFENCHLNKINIVIPKIGHNFNSIGAFAQTLRDKFGYTVHLTLVSLDRRKATLRAVNRFIKSGRYVPLSLIFDGYGNDPILTFYRLRGNTFSDYSFIKSYGKISTDVDKGKPPLLINSDIDNPAFLFK